MPKKSTFSYGGTITFDSSYTLDKKNKLIDLFPDMLAKHLLYSNDRRYYLKVAKEYHKVKCPLNKTEEEDKESPHLHYVLESDTLLPKYRVRAIQNYFKEKYGRSQFYLMTALKTKQYTNYIQKDSQRLLEETGIPHYIEMNLEDNVRSYWSQQYLTVDAVLDDMEDEERIDDLIL